MIRTLISVKTHDCDPVLRGKKEHKRKRVCGKTIAERDSVKSVMKNESKMWG